MGCLLSARWALRSLGHFVARYDARFSVVNEERTRWRIAAGKHGVNWGVDSQVTQEANLHHRWALLKLVDFTNSCSWWKAVHIVGIMLWALLDISGDFPLSTISITKCSLPLVTK